MGRHAILLLLGLLVAARGAAGATLPSPGLVVHTLKGTLRTSRTLRAAPNRIWRSQADVNSEVFVLGLREASQLQIRDALQGLGGQVLHALPNKPPNWVVRARSDSIQLLLDAHPDVTVALLPDTFKTSPVVDKAISICEHMSQQACVKAIREQLPFLSMATECKDEACLEVVAVAPGMSAQTLQQLARQAASDLGRLSNAQSSPVKQCVPKAQAVSHGLSITVCPKGLSMVSSWLTSQAAVSWVDLQHTHQISNVHASAIIQNAAKVNSTPPPDVLSTNSLGTHFPLWQAGLDGTGQVVGVADTGLDMDSCYLWDPKFINYMNGSSTSFVPPDRSSRLTNYTVFRNTTHRKVVMYAGLYDMSDDSGGHGTHVATTLVGSAYGYDALKQPDLGTGVIPRAKVAMMDIGRVVNGLPTIMALESDYSRIWEPLIQAGARVTSNSWGLSSASDYMYHAPICYQLDAYTWSAQDTLHVFAAGNAGMDARFANTGTTQAPATCKNVLSVGATESWISMGVGQARQNLTDAAHTRLPVNTSDYRGPWDHGVLTIQSKDISFSISLDSQAMDFIPIQGLGPSGLLDPIGAYGDMGVQVTLAVPPHGCVAQQVLLQANNTPTMVLISTSLTKPVCSVSTSIRNAILAGAQGDSIFPAAVLRTSLGSQLFNQLRDTPSGVNTAHAIWKRKPVLPPFESIAHFSAYSSLLSALEAQDFADRRFKPDIVAAGYTFGATSDGLYSGEMDRCATVTISGTSMAAPVVSGAAVLARQYFVDGFYPAGVRGSGLSYEPSAPLLKAVLIAGAAAMKGVSRANNQPLKPPPSAFQGHGRLDLGASLPLAGDKKGWNLQVLDKALFTEDGVSHLYNITVGSSNSNATNNITGPLSVALAWHDFPGFPGAIQVAVNDLTLSVLGPLESNTPQLYWGNGVDGGDEQNNVEKVHIQRPIPGTYQINITSVYLFISARPQPYGLAVLGAVQSTIDSPYNPVLTQRGPTQPIV